MIGVFAGPYIQETSIAQWLTLDAKTLAVILPIYAFFAAALPVWLLLAPRDYLSSFMKIGVFVALIAGVFVINPVIRFPAFTEFAGGGGPVIAGPVWPFISITIACGAISGFHAFVGSGTTPKMINQWTDIKVIGFGAMLVECVVGIMALIAATALHPADYFAINSAPAVFQTLGMHVENLPQLSKEIGMDLEGRTGGAVTLAVGMSYIFTKIPWFSHLAPFFFQFVIMFEAVFILTAIDSGTRVSRYLIQDFFGELYKPLKRTDWLPGNIFASALACFMWGYLLFSGDISSVSGIVHKDQLVVCVKEWKLLKETGRYYEIKSEDANVKRVYKEKLGVIQDDTKAYANGLISNHTFCALEDIETMKSLIITELDSKISSYLQDLLLNRKALESSDENSISLHITELNR
ncbi:hypothetical protein BGX30_005608 [Mortierella sp. GBA39]|nr:hypothetical protein BGX30_005608 [Mortierella sp. GBA39]